MIEIRAKSTIVVDIRNVSYRTSRETVLDRVSLTVPRGKVVALLGPPKSGKSALQKLVLGEGTPTAGKVRVFGQDPTAGTLQVFGLNQTGGTVRVISQGPTAGTATTPLRVGYVPQMYVLPGDRCLADLQADWRKHCPGWDRSSAQALCKEFRIDARAELARLPEEQRFLAPLILVLAGRPDLLVLDDFPSRDRESRDGSWRQALVGSLDEGMSVLLSPPWPLPKVELPDCTCIWGSNSPCGSLDEARRLADCMVLLNSGKVDWADKPDRFFTTHHQITLASSVWHEPPILPDVVWWRWLNGHWYGIVRGDFRPVRAALSKSGFVGVGVTRAPAGEILLTYQLKKKGLGAWKSYSLGKEGWVQRLEAIINMYLNEDSGREGRTASQVSKDANQQESSAAGIFARLFVDVANGEILDLWLCPAAAPTQDHSGKEQ
jgi:ABC-2 type transport system ATP-binding protein